MNIIGNIAMFIPVGIIWPICFKKLDNIGKTILAGAGFTLLIELSQLFCYGRHTDIDDLILNTTGVAIGAVIVFAIRKARAK
jgi:glycopeptide antibiotics resistance protein